MISPEMRPEVSEHTTAAVKSKTPLIKRGQNALVITIGDRNIVIPRKERYGIPDIGNAIGSDNPRYIQNKLWRARKKNPDINPQHLGIGQRHSTLVLPEKDFVLAVTTIIPTIEGEEGRRQKEPITLPDGQVIKVRGEKQIGVLRLLITAFNQDQPYVSNEEPLGLDITKGIPPSRMKTRRLYKRTVARLKNTTLTGTGWDIQSITVNGKSVGERPRGYTLKKENAQKADTPALLLQSVLDNNTVLKEVVTNGPKKSSILEEAKQQINSLEPQEKVLFLEKTFAILSDPDPNYQNKRDAGLEILNIMDLKSIDPKELTEMYIQAVHNLREDLNQDSDPYGEIHMLLEAGKTIAPFIINRQRIMQVWRCVANTFPKYEENGDDGKDRQKILNDMKTIRQIIILKTLSEFDANVLKLVKKDLRNPEIAEQLGVRIEYVQRSKCRLQQKGVRFRSSNTL